MRVSSVGLLELIGHLHPIAAVFGLVRVFAKIVECPPTSLEFLNRAGSQGRSAEQKEGQEDLA
jgi:uncharacterized membrane protein YkvI